MKLKKYNHTNVSATRKGEPLIRISRKPGLLSFTKEAVEMTGLKAGDRIDFFQDEESVDWYISRTEGDDGFLLRSDKTTQRLKFNASALIDLILPSVKLTKDSFACRIANKPIVLDPQGRELWCIIMASAQ